MQRNTIRILSAIIIIALIVGLTACISTKTDVSGSVLYVGLVTHSLDYGVSPFNFPVKATSDAASGSSPDALRLNLNPLTADDLNSNQIIGLIYEPLLAYGTGLEEELRLAGSVEYSEDFLKVTYKLKENVVWHDGTPLTAADVVWSYRTIKDFPEGRYFQYLRYMKSINAEDDYTVTINYISPLSFNPAIIIPILPKHIWGELHTNDLGVFANIDPVGTGSMIYSRMTKDSVSLVKNPAYYGEEPGPDQIQFTFYDTEDMMIDAIREGKVDIVGGLRHRDQKALEDIGAVNVVSLPSFSRLILAMNVSEVEYSGGNPALLDVKVRKALDTLIDKDELLGAADADFGVPGESLLPEAMDLLWQGESDVYTSPSAMAEQGEFESDRATGSSEKSGVLTVAAEQSESDTYTSPSAMTEQGESTGEPGRVEKAVKLLEEAGYANVGEDGMRVNEEGIPLSLRLFASEDDPMNMSIAKKIVSMAAKAGIAIQTETISQGRIKAMVSDDAPNFDLMMMWADVSAPDPSYAMNLALTGFGKKINPFNYSNRAYDDLYRKQFKEMDRGLRRETIRGMDEIFAADVPGIVLLYPKLYQAYRTDKWTGYSDTAGGVIFNFSYDNYTDIRPL